MIGEDDETYINININERDINLDNEDEVVKI